MNLLRIRLFGGLQIWRGDEPLPAFPTQRASSLFAYLLLHRSRLHARDRLIGQLWGDEPEETGRKALRMALWRVRGVVDDPAGEARSILRTAGSTLGIDPDSTYWLDVAEFEHLLTGSAGDPARPLTEGEAQVLRAAVDLYAGDLLEDCYDEWCLYERERLRLLYHSALERLMRFEQDRFEWGAAIVLGQRLLALDPLMEQVHRELMRSHMRRGSRASALRQFDSCVATLRRELGVGPMPETIELFHRIRGDEPAPLAATHPSAPLLDRVERALDSIYGITGQLEEARSRLRPAISPADRKGDRPQTLLVEAPPGRF